VSRRSWGKWWGRVCPGSYLLCRRPTPDTLPPHVNSWAIPREGGESGGYVPSDMRAKPQAMTTHTALKGCLRFFACARWDRWDPSVRPVELTFSGSSFLVSASEECICRRTSSYFGEVNISPLELPTALPISALNLCCPPFCPGPVSWT